MMEQKKLLIKKIEESLNSEGPFEEINPKIKELRAAFVQLVKEVHAVQEKEHVESNAEVEFKVMHDETDGRFSELMAQFNEKRKKWEDQKAHEQQQNLEKKLQIVHDLEKLAEEEQHIGHAFERFGELKEKWRSTGQVPSGEYRELQTKYSYAIERFFYHINIYKTLKEYDLKKNLEFKKELIKKVKDLEKNKNIKDCRDLISEYIKEWDELGPTAQNEWEKVRDEFWENVRLVHKRVGDHFKELKEKRKENFQKKEALCEEVEKMAESGEGDHKHWNKVNKRMAEIRAEWKAIGFAGKKENDKVWERFKAANDKLYVMQKGVQEQMRDVFKENEERKLVLIAQAEELKNSLDWKSTTEAMKRLQERWKKTGPASQGKEQKLWKRFRTSVNHFFEAKKDYFDNREEREGKNLQQKKELLEELKALDASSKDAAKAMKEYGVKWNAISEIPRNERQALDKSFNDLLARKLKESGKNESEITGEVFKMKLEGIKSSDNSEFLLKNEHRFLEEKLKKIEADILQYENNLGFFGEKSEGNPLVLEVMKKIEASRTEAAELKSRIAMLQD
ncbi:MAG: DUF349 domain-containing protein [Vicingaceae bacterium]